jgi:uncharacterized membrane protein YphA (DoxX/SURF4 family)
MTKKQWAREIATWILTALLCLMFARAGLLKFDGASGWSRLFRNVGFPVWFRIFIGVWEVGAALLILIPRTALYGALMIVAVMIGAAITMAMQNPAHAITPVAWILMSATLAALRWRR